MEVVVNLRGAILRILLVLALQIQHCAMHVCYCMFECAHESSCLVVVLIHAEEEQQVTVQCGPVQCFGEKPCTAGGVK